MGETVDYVQDEGAILCVLLVIPQCSPTVNHPHEVSCNGSLFFCAAVK